MVPGLCLVFSLFILAFSHRLLAGQEHVLSHMGAWPRALRDLGAICHDYPSLRSGDESDVEEELMTYSPPNIT